MFIFKLPFATSGAELSAPGNVIAMALSFQQQMSIATVVMQILSRGTLDGTFEWEAIQNEDTQNQDVFPGEFIYTPGNDGSLYVSGETTNLPSPKPTLTLTSHLGQNVGLGKGQVGSFPAK